MKESSTFQNKQSNILNLLNYVISDQSTDGNKINNLGISYMLEAKWNNLAKIDLSKIYSKLKLKIK